MYLFAISFYQKFFININFAILSCILFHISKTKEYSYFEKGIEVVMHILKALVQSKSLRRQAFSIPHSESI